MIPDYHIFKENLGKITLDELIKEAKDTIQWYDLMLTPEGEDEFRKFLNPGIMAYVYSLPDSITSFEEFSGKKHFTKLRMNFQAFVEAWILDTKNHKEKDLNNNNLKRIKGLWEKFTGTVCPGFLPFC